MRNALRWMAAAGAALVFLAPLLWMVAASFRTESTIFSTHFPNWFTTENWTVSNYADAWRRAALGGSFLVSLAQVIAISAGGLLLNAMAAYAFARMHFPGRDILFAGVVSLVVLPLEVMVVPLFFVARDLGLTGGVPQALGGLVLPFLVKAFNIYFLRQHFLSLPTALEEAAVMDGAGAWRQFWNVALPSVRPALATVALLDILAHWGDFLWPLLLSTRAETRTVQLSMANLFTQPPIQWGQILACAVMTTLPVIVLFRYFQRHLVTSAVTTGIK